MKTTHNMFYLILSVLAVAGAAFGINYLINRKKENTTPTPTIPPVTGGSGGGSGGTTTVLPSYTLCDAYLTAGDYQSYASPQDAVDKNQAGAGVTNRSRNFYVGSLTTGETLYLDSSATNKVVGPIYLYAPSINKAITVNANGIMTLYTGTINNLPPFIIKDAYLDGTYQPYASLTEALDKNLEGSGVTNRDATIYASSMVTGQKAYTSGAATTPYAQGKYFYLDTWEMLNIAVDGTMTFSTDVNKTGLNPLDIKDSYQ